MKVAVVEEFFDGSTANGILTFKDSDEATVESRLTFSDPVVGSGNEYILEFGDVNNGSSDKAIIRPVRTATGSYSNGCKLYVSAGQGSASGSTISNTGKSLIFIWWRSGNRWI